MPQGSTHDRITLWSLPLVAILSWLLTRNGDLALIICASFLFSGLMFGPDLDIYSIQFKRWGKLSFIWLPYQKLLRHRSILSHGFLIGTILRSIYLSVCLGIVGIFTVAIAQSIWGFEWNWRQFILSWIKLLTGDYRSSAIAIFVGLELGASSHIISDRVASAAKKHRKAKKRPVRKSSPRNKRRSKTGNK